MSTFSLSSAVSLEDPEQLFRVIEVVGQGSFGIVCTCEHITTGAIVAIKFIEIEDEEDESGNKGLLRELDIMKSSNGCAQMVQYHGSYLKEGHLMIVMEYCNGGSVQDIIKLCKVQLTEDQIGAILYHMLEGLQYLHTNKILHRDVKAGNVLLTSDGKAKLADFGVSARLMNADQKQKTVVGSPYWMSPEVIISTGYDHKADIWSLGITCLEMAEGRPPHYEISPMRVIFIIPHRPPPTLHDPSRWSPEFKNFVDSCLNKDPALRPTTVELLNHPFITRHKPQADLVIKELVEKNIPVLAEARAKKAAEGSDEDSDDEDNGANGLSISCGSVLRINTITKHAEVLGGKDRGESFDKTVVYRSFTPGASNEEEGSGTVIFQKGNTVLFRRGDADEGEGEDPEAYSSGSVVSQGSVIEHTTTL
eukprot:TRINITY_DN4733_c0_g1_i1.p1 TRINITY_DN4733_c0_g1~~TRINITY_DN4733_c0_g1_i1.p1  ORF type:complete len:421 (+),score=86.42 TRINITY_DN4733_c0_g1_i1:205-1467(+)